MGSVLFGASRNVSGLSGVTFSRRKESRLHSIPLSRVPPPQNAPGLTMGKESNENTEQRRNNWNIQQKTCVYKYGPCYFGFEDPECFGCNGSDVKAKEYGFESISDRVVQTPLLKLPPPGETVSEHLLLSCQKLYTVGKMNYLMVIQMIAGFEQDHSNIEITL
jgi:hypothetical protein